MSREQEHASLKWEMIDQKTFVARKGVYKVTVLTGGSIGIIWTITKESVVWGDVLVDSCYRYPPTHNELAGKVQAERVLQKLLTTNPISHE